MLKVQEHSYHLPELLATYPDAVFIQPHRDPVTVMASIARLIEVIRGVAFDCQDRAALAEELLFLWHDGQVASMEFRRTHPYVPVYDLPYSAISRDPIAAIRGIYEFAALPFTEESESGMRDWLSANPADKHGRHSYSLADYGLTNARVRDVYADYCDTYAAYI